MSAGDSIQALTRAVLYEGWVLYPYRPDAIKNRRRFLFGSLFPPAWAVEHGEPAALEAQVLLEGAPALDVRARFLHGHVERDVGPGPLRFDDLAGRVEVRVDEVEPGLSRVTVRVENLTPADPTRPREEVEPLALASAHVLLRATSPGASFVSLTDPPEGRREAAAACRQTGVWPALVGPPGSRDAMLAAPIVLPDHPAVAPESPGDFFDGTEIDELLTLRLLTLTDEEKAAVRAGDPRAAALLERTEALGLEALRGLHGARTNDPDSLAQSSPTLHVRRDCWVSATSRVGSSALARDAPPPVRPGDRVRLRPRARGADAMDVVLRGLAATVQAVETDFEGRVHVAVTVDDDPGRDLGEQGLPGHRFYFGQEEVERL